LIPCQKVLKTSVLVKTCICITISWSSNPAASRTYKARFIFDFEEPVMIIDFAHFYGVLKKNLSPRMGSDSVG